MIRKKKPEVLFWILTQQQGDPHLPISRLMLQDFGQTSGNDVFQIHISSKYKIKIFYAYKK